MSGFWIRQVEKKAVVQWFAKKNDVRTESCAYTADKLPVNHPLCTMIRFKTGFIYSFDIYFCFRRIVQNGYLGQSGHRQNREVAPLMQCSASPPPLLAMPHPCSAPPRRASLRPNPPRPLLPCSARPRLAPPRPWDIWFLDSMGARDSILSRTREDVQYERSSPGRTASPVLASTRPAGPGPDRLGPVPAWLGPALARRCVRVLNPTITSTSCISQFPLKHNN